MEASYENENFEEENVDEDFEEYNVCGDSDGFDDGLSGDDFSSEDDEFLEARKNKMNEKWKKTCIKNEFQIIELQEDEIVDTTNRDGEGIQATNQKKPMVYAKNCDHKNLQFEIGMRFKDVVECKEAVKTWTIVNGFNIKWTKSSHGKLQSICVQNCPWRFYASKLTFEPTCVIKSYVGKHTCLRDTRNRQANSAWLSNQFIEQLKVNPNCKAKEIKRLVNLKFGVDVTISMCYKAKNLALQKMRGSYIEHYKKLRSYVAE